MLVRVIHHSYLLKLPLDVIKLDRSFVIHLEKGSKTLAVLEGMLPMFQKLYMRIVIEGMETQEQADLLIAIWRYWKIFQFQTIASRRGIRKGTLDR